MGGGLTIVYCTSCGVQNAQGARFCINCGAPLDLKGPAPPGAAAPPYQPPYPPPYAPAPPARTSQACEQRPGQEEECLGQRRVPGLVVFAVIVLMIGVIAVIQWFLEQTYPGTNYTNLIWPIGGIVLALVLIGVWLVARPRVR